MGYLGARTTLGVLSANNRITAGGWVVTFTPEVFQVNDAEFEIWHGSLRGPGGYALVYIENDLFGVAENGEINEYSPAGGAMFIRKGQTVTLHWSINSGSAPQVWFYLREPEIGPI